MRLTELQSDKCVECSGSWRDAYCVLQHIALWS